MKSLLKLVLVLLASFVAMFAPKVNAVTIQIPFTADAGMVASDPTNTSGSANTFNLKDGTDRAYVFSASIPLSPPPGEVWTLAELFLPTTGSPASLAASQYTIQTAGGNVFTTIGETTINASLYVTAFGAWTSGIATTSANLLSLILPKQGQTWTGLAVANVGVNANLKQDDHPQGGGYLQLTSSPVPEPSAALLAFGALPLVVRRRRK